MAERAKDFKHTSRNEDETRERRRQGTVELRKKGREVQAMKRRNVGQAVFEEAVASEPIAAQSMQLLNGILEGIMSDDPELQLHATSRLRRLLSQAEQVDNIVDAVIELEVVPVLVRFLQQHEHPMLQFEAAWCLTNIASGEERQTRVVVKSGAVPLFVQLLHSNSKEVREQALWAIGNIAGDGPKLRDMVLDLNIIDLVLHLVNFQPSLSMLRTATWTLANLCRGRPGPDFNKVRVIVPQIAYLIKNSEDPQILIDAAWALSYLTDGDNEQIQEVVNQDVVSRLVHLLSFDDHELQKPTLRALGNIVTGDEEQTQAVLDCNPLPIFLKLLYNGREYIRKETCWAISNILAGTPEQLNAVINANIIPPLIKLITEGEAKVRREAAWAITNLICGGTDEQIRYVITQGCIRPLIEVLDVPDPKLIQVVLDGIREILRFGTTIATPDDPNPCASWIEEADGNERIELLQHHENLKIYQKANYIINTYFQSNEHSMPDSSIQPQQSASGDYYAFGGNMGDMSQPGGFNL